MCGLLSFLSFFFFFFWGGGGGAKGEQYMCIIVFTHTSGSFSIAFAQHAMPLVRRNAAKFLGLHSGAEVEAHAKL